MLLLSELNRTAVAQWLRCWAKNRKVAGSSPASVTGIFIEINSFRSYYGLSFGSASKKKRITGAYPRGKVGRCVRLTNLPPSCAVVTISGNLNFPESSVPLQTCNCTVKRKTTDLLIWMTCPSSTPLSFIDSSACCVHTLRPITFTSIIFLKFSGEPSAENKCELVLWKQLIHPYMRVSIRDGSRSLDTSNKFKWFHMWRVWLRRVCV